MTTYFISDLHLRGEQPQLQRRFDYFVDHIAHTAEAVYILGDLFEVWLGDDMVLPDYQPALAAIRRLTAQTIPVFVMYGNRDFLMRAQFCADTGAQLLLEPSLLSLYGTQTLLMHGDVLCSDDTRYQQFRAMVRNPQFQSQFLAKTPQQRLAMVQEYRQLSKTETQYKSADIMDVNQTTVENTLRQHHVNHLIHGHTHRPAIHTFTLDSKPAKRIVLGDWENRGYYLRCSPAGCELITFNH
ncbi:MAG: UDP-2,3-diacylglucosamine diphosphatase [Gammaproteobacteria bacterium]|nr:UDP-2,3-diacylglucosamine diphosphatase [Gammaproteobacteria bacterium]